MSARVDSESPIPLEPKGQFGNVRGSEGLPGQGRPGAVLGLQRPHQETAPQGVEEPGFPSLCFAPILGYVFVGITHVQTCPMCRTPSYQHWRNLPACSLTQVVT